MGEPTPLWGAPIALKGQALPLVPLWRPRLRRPTFPLVIVVYAGGLHEWACSGVRDQWGGSVGASGGAAGGQ